MPVEVRPYRSEDRPGVRSLVEGILGSTKNFDHYEGGNPLGEALRVVAVQGGRVVGYNQWNPWLVQTAEQTVTVYQSGTSAVDRSLWGQGVFARLLALGMRAAQEQGIAAFVGFPNPVSYRSFLRDGWRHVQSLGLYVCAVPSLARRTTPLETSFERSPITAFVEWRYRCAGAEQRSVRIEGEWRKVYYLRQRVRGLPVLRLLDVLDKKGRRSFASLVSVARQLPGPAAVYLRTSHPSPWPAMAIRRRWQTPVIVKPVAADSATMHLLENAAYVYGDIDAA